MSVDDAYSAEEEYRAFVYSGLVQRAFWFVHHGWAFKMRGGIKSGCVRAMTKVCVKGSWSCSGFHIVQLVAIVK